MRTVMVIGLLVVVALSAQAQNFPFGQVTVRDLDMKVYDKDTSAIAVVLNEFGDAQINTDAPYGSVLIFKYHIKIKILKAGGLAYGTFEIPLQRADNLRSEKIWDIRASTFVKENGAVREIKMDWKSQFVDDVTKTYKVHKFALPNVTVGSIIDVQYETESPYIFNYHTWLFQADIPKVRSEYWANMPGNYDYNVSLRGYLPLTKQTDEIVRHCVMVHGGSSDCVLVKFTMVAVPAFKEEEYMPAIENIRSGIYFELREVKYFDGTTKKFTKEWKDVESELRTDKEFGVQLKRGENVVEDKIKPMVAGVTDPLVKAQKVYDFIKGHFTWNEQSRAFTKEGVKKAFDEGVGNTAEINLTLVGALRAAGLTADPVLLSTRQNGRVTELYPVITEYNYVVAQLVVADKTYLLDATEDLLPLGQLPYRCLNGKGRVFTEKGSEWVDLTPAQREKTVTMMNLTLSPDGHLKGTIQITHYGYDAYFERSKLFSETNESIYLKNVADKWSDVVVSKKNIENAKELTKPLVVKLEVDMEAFDPDTQASLLFNPFRGSSAENPFKSAERLYPVDFGVPQEELVILNLQIPDNFVLDEMPAKAGLALPNNGGRYLFNVQVNANAITLNSNLQLTKTVYSPEEYHFLRELYARMVAIKQADLVFKKKT